MQDTALTSSPVPEKRREGPDQYLDSMNQTMERHGLGRQPDVVESGYAPLKDRVRLHISHGQDLLARLADSDRLTADARVALLDAWYQDAHNLLREGAPDDLVTWFVTEDDVGLPFSFRLVLGLTGGLTIAQARAQLRARLRIDRLRKTAERL